MDDFIIYGAASIGDIVLSKLEACHVCVIGFIDKRADEIGRYNDLPVWTIEDVPTQYVTDKIAVFVGVKNVFEHEGIARALSRKGFSKVVYKPYNVLLGNGSEDEIYISQVYDSLFQAVSADICASIPACPALKGENLCDYALLETSNTEIVAYIPLDFIYTNHYRHGGMVKWGDISILSLFTHIDFFRYLDNCTDASPEPYLKEYCEYTAGLQNNITITDAWRSNVIKNRIQIFERMNENLNLDFDFFIRNAPEAVWNPEKHIFNLMSGKHRSAFFAAKGIRYIPLKIKKDDYAIFYHQEAAENVGELLFNTEESILIPHPCFYRDDRVYDGGTYAFLMWFARYYGRKMFYQHGRVSFQQIEIVDCLDDMGDFARFVERLGCVVYRQYYPSKLEEALNKLFYAKFLYQKSGWDKDSTHKIIIVEEKNIGVLNPYIDQSNEIIIKYCASDKIVGICDRWNLKVTLKISERFENLERKATYLLEHKR